MSQKSYESKRRQLRQWIKRKVGMAPTAPKLQQGVFGVPLSDSICYAYWTASYVDEEKLLHASASAIPIVVAKCGRFLKNHALHTTGIFRRSGNCRRIQMLQAAFDEYPNYGRDIDLEKSEYNVHDVGTVLRRYLLTLPERVIPGMWVDAFLDALHTPQDKSSGAVIRSIQNLMDRLPLPHQHLLLYILDLLNLFAYHASDTRMDIANLATVFSPTLFDHTNYNTPEGYEALQRVTRFLVTHQTSWHMQFLPMAYIQCFSPPSVMSIHTPSTLVEDIVNEPRSLTPVSISPSENAKPDLGTCRLKSTPGECTDADTRHTTRNLCVVAAVGLVSFYYLMPFITLKMFVKTMVWITGLALYWRMVLYAIVPSNGV